MVCINRCLVFVECRQCQILLRGKLWLVDSERMIVFLVVVVCSLKLKLWQKCLCSVRFQVWLRWLLWGLWMISCMLLDLLKKCFIISCWFLGRLFRVWWVWVRYLMICCVVLLFSLRVVLSQVMVGFSCCFFGNVWFLLSSLLRVLCRCVMLVDSLLLCFGVLFSQNGMFGGWFWVFLICICFGLMWMIWYEVLFSWNILLVRFFIVKFLLIVFISRFCGFSSMLQLLVLGMVLFEVSVVSCVLWWLWSRLLSVL